LSQSPNPPMEGRCLKNRARLRKPDQILLQVCQMAMQRIAASVAKLPELLVSPTRAICSSTRLPQLLRVRYTLYASEMSSQGVRWQLPPLAPHSTWQHLQIEDKERSPSREVSS